ncbi:hypothetical protein GQ607_001254 [Colletotrichum asianum]|uniref:Uncharacterized protein n=1 Tax=Colletotrichum asianum TaxID=702518 RepID=A0A8H3ZTP4_9PEZI|nr:hypothetical protein GQ607_001254 [Colletotrichum asianum]
MDVGMDAGRVLTYLHRRGWTVLDQNRRTDTPRPAGKIEPAGQGMESENVSLEAYARACEGKGPGGVEGNEGSGRSRLAQFPAVSLPHGEILAGSTGGEDGHCHKCRGSNPK